MSNLGSTPLPPFEKKLYFLFIFGLFPKLLCSLFKFATYTLRPTIISKTNSGFKLIYYSGPLEQVPGSDTRSLTIYLNNTRSIIYNKFEWTRYNIINFRVLLSQFIEGLLYTHIKLAGFVDIFEVSLHYLVTLNL